MADPEIPFLLLEKERRGGGKEVQRRRGWKMGFGGNEKIGQKKKRE